MSEVVQWELPERSPGRLYFYPRDLVPKYEHVEGTIERMHANISQCVKLESAVRITLDHPKAQPTTTVLTVPFHGEADPIYDNMAHIVHEQMWGYYLSANPKTTHHGLSHLVFDGNETNLLYREIEKLLDMLSYRPDIAARVMKNYQMATETPPFNRDVYMKSALEQVLNIHLGVRMFTYGEGVHNATVFVPIAGSEDALNWIYYNIEHILHVNFAAYDELHDRQLPVSETLIYREMSDLLVRARHKGNTRKKIINGLTMHTVLMDDPAMIHHVSLADFYYDKINRIDLLDEASARSRDLFNTVLLRSAEITLAAGVNVDAMPMEERVYIDRSTAVGEPVPEMASMAAPEPQEEAVVEAAPEPIPEPVPVAAPAAPENNGDGMEEL